MPLSGPIQKPKPLCSSPIPRATTPTAATLNHFLAHITAVNDPHTSKLQEDPLPEPILSSLTISTTSPQSSSPYITD